MTREYPVSPMCAVGAVVCYDGKVLLVRRRQEPARGRWVIPGGRVELGERVEEAVRREVREECGIDIKVGALAAVVDRIDRDEDGRVRYHYVIVDYFAEFAGGALSPGSDAVEARWVDPDHLAAYGVNQVSTHLILTALERHRTASSTGT